MNFYVGVPDPKQWWGRMAFAAEILKQLPHKYIYDFGAGSGKLGTIISQQYFGFDAMAYPAVQKIDFNVALPLVKNGKKEERAAVCLGLLEYLQNVPHFLDYLKGNFQISLITYRVLSKKKIAQCDRFLKKRFKSCSVFYSPDAFRGLLDVSFRNVELIQNFDDYILAYLVSDSALPALQPAFSVMPLKAYKPKFFPKKDRRRAR